MAFQKIPNAKQGNFYGNRIIDILTGSLLFYFEFSNVPLKERVWVSLFQSVTPRTAGFNTADLTLFSEVGQMLIIMLMLIGGSPGSTADRKSTRLNSSHPSSSRMPSSA